MALATIALSIAALSLVLLRPRPTRHSPRCACGAEPAGWFVVDEQGRPICLTCAVRRAETWNEE